MPFQTKITRARWVLGPFTSEDMETIGGVLADSIGKRIAAGLNANDEQAKPLKPGRNGRRGYPDYKAARGLQPFRDWFWTGRTMRSLKVKSASENRVVIGFVDPNADRIAHVNNLPREGVRRVSQGPPGVARHRALGAAAVARNSCPEGSLNRFDLRRHMRRKELPWSVYALRDPNTGCVRYVGWSIDPMARLKRHLKEARLGKTHKCRWLASLGDSWPILQILESGFGDPGPAEIRWIAEMKSRGFDLTNATGGGDGVIEASPELRRLRSMINKGRKPSEETRRKLAEASRNRPVKDSTRAKMVAIAKARFSSDEERRKLSASLKGHKRSGEFRKMRREIQTGKWASRETRRRMALAQYRRRVGNHEGQLCLTLSP